MATHSSTLAWKLPQTEEPGGLKSMGSLRVRHDWATSLSLFTFMHWRRKWQRTPVFLPGESQGRRSPVGCHLWGHTESDMTDVTYQQQQQLLWTTKPMDQRGLFLNNHLASYCLKFKSKVNMSNWEILHCIWIASILILSLSMFLWYVQRVMAFFPVK